MLFATGLATVIAYLAATALHLGTVFGDRPRLQRSALIVTAVGALANLALVITQHVHAGGAALLEVNGGITFGGLVVVVAYLWLAWRFDLGNLGSFVTPIAALAAMVNVVDPVKEATGGLHSGILVAHITLAFVGTAGFALAFVFSLLYVVQERQLKLKRFTPWSRRFPSLDKLDGFTLRFVGGGFAVYTVSLILGLFWAWRNSGIQLEPRSVLSVLTWLVYAIIIQARITAGWRGRRAAQLVIVGAIFAVGVIVAYFLRPGV